MNASSKPRDEQPKGGSKNSLRPVLYIGLGGFGCSVVRRTKSLLQEARPKEIDGFAFLGLDTQRRSNSDLLSRNEYLELSVGVDPKRVARENPDQLAWFLDTVGAYRPKSIKGADMVKAVGRLAFRYAPTFTKFVSQLKTAVTRLNKMRDGFTPGEPLKVYFITTLAGGTGAGCFLDVMGVVGQLLRRQVGPDFPYHAILATADQLQGEVPDVQLPKLQANTYASLKELHHFLATDDSPVLNYGMAEFSRMKFDSVNLPKAIHIIGDKNENGSVIVDDNDQLADIVVHYLLSDVLTPLSDKAGQPKIQDLENSHMHDPGKDGMPRAFSSLGVVRAGIPIELLERYYGAMLIDAFLEAEVHEPHDIVEKVSTWIDACKLKEAASDQLQDRLKVSLPAETFSIAVDARGAILGPGFKYARLVQSSKRFWQESLKTHEGEFKSSIQKRGSEVSDQLLSQLDEKITTAFDQENIGAVVSFLRQLKLTLKINQEALTEELSQSEEAVIRLEKEVEGAILDIETASQHFFGRRRQVESAVSDLGGRIELLLAQKSDVWVKQQCAAIYAVLLERCDDQSSKWLAVRDSLIGFRDFARESVAGHSIELDALADIGRRGAGNRFSLINSADALVLYKEMYEESMSSVLQRMRDTLRSVELLTESRQEPEIWLSKASHRIIEKEIHSPLDKFDLIEALRRFYPTENDVQALFQDLDALSLPLFPLDPDRQEANYEKWWIVAVHPFLRSSFDSSYSAHLAGEGKCYAEAESMHEVQLYQFKLGYTIHSMLTLNGYLSDYQRAVDTIREHRRERKPVPPVHCWPEGEIWEDLFPDAESQTAAKWFVLGRAFSRLFPSPEAASPEDRKNTAYIYNRGANYYMKMDSTSKATTIGKGLAAAFRNFTDRLDWQECVQKAVTKKKAEVGEQEILQRLESEFLPVIQKEIEVSRNQNEDGERAAVLERLVKALREYMDQELTSARV